MRCSSRIATGKRKGMQCNNNALSGNILCGVHQQYGGSGHQQYGGNGEFTYRNKHNNNLIHTSDAFKEFAHKYLGDEYEQAGDLPVWLGKDYVVKLVGDEDYLDAVVFAHSRLEEDDMSSRLIDTFSNGDDGEYGVAEEFVRGINLGTIPKKKAMKMINAFVNEIDKKYPTSDWDSNPENYIIDENTGTIKVIDLGDLYFEDSP